jgi:hypothetical protein
MSSDSTSTGASHPSFEELDGLSTEELRERAFHLARERHDVKFFVTVIRHLPHADDMADQEGSLITDMVALWQEFSGHGYGDAEPMLRAAFIDYLMKN